MAHKKESTSKRKLSYETKNLLPLRLCTQTETQTKQKKHALQGILTEFSLVGGMARHAHENKLTELLARVQHQRELHMI